MVSKAELDKKLFLLDAYALVYRAYYAFIKTPRYSSKGLNTSAILGFTNTLLEVLEQEKPTHIAVVFDPSGKTFRHDMFPNYKGQRPPTPEDIKQSIPYIKKLLKAMNIASISIEGFEADDVIGTLAKRAEKEGYSVYMMTPDKDYAQLVSENIYMYKPKKSGREVELMGVKEVLSAFGIERIDQVVDILGLMGDAADNVPGCPGIGEKTAIKLIAKYGSIENLYKNLSDLKGKQKENLENCIDQVKLSRELVVIEVNVPCKTNIDSLQIADINRDELKELFTELEFVVLAQKILGEFGEREELKTLESLEHTFFNLDDKLLLADLRADLCIQEEFAFYTELSDEDPNKAKPLSISFSLKNNKCFYVKLPSDTEELNKVILSFKSIFEDRRIGKISNDIKKEMLWLKWFGINLEGDIFDVKIAHYLYKPDGDHKFEKVTEELLKYSLIKSDKNSKQVQLSLFDSQEEEENIDIPCEKVLVYNKLKPELIKKLKDTNTYDLFIDIEMPLVSVLVDMEYEGISISTESLKELSQYLAERINTISKEIWELVGEEFNISSPKRLGEMLFDKLKIDEKAKRTSSGQYSTSEPVLEKLRSKHEVIDKILEYRSLSKLLNTYSSTLHTHINPRTNKIHTSYNQAEAVTGRLSSVNPNLQNIPIRTEEGRKIRKAFVSSDNEHILVSADYSQIELRLMAHLSGDKDMVEAFLNNEDIHTATASKIYKVPMQEVDKEMRRRAKTANFGIIYGISAWGLAERLRIPRKEGKELIEGYFNTYPGVQTYIDESISKAKENEYVETIMGRKRYLKDINSKNSIVRSVAERNAINAPLQGSAADIIKLAMINVHKRLKAEKLSSKMILQIHDELIFDCLINEKELLEKIIKEEMQDVVKLKVPLTIDLGSGSNWLDAH